MFFSTSASQVLSAISPAATLRSPAKNPAYGGLLLLLGDPVREIGRLDVTQSIVQQEGSDGDELQARGNGSQPGRL